jgi:uroporphyrinogen decarboxylase
MQFSPSIYEHAARVIGKSPWEVSRSAELLAAGNIEAFRLYKHRPVVVGIDIYNLEAEAYGAKVEKPLGNGIPAISKHTFSSVEEILQLGPFDPKTDGRIQMVIEAARRVVEQCPEADVRIPLGGPFSVATNLIGFEPLLSEIATNRNLVREALCHLVAGQVGFSREIIDNGLDIAFFESAAVPPLMSPRDFREIELPALKEIIEGAAAVVGHPVPCLMGGDTTPILDAILDTGTGYVCCPSETNQQDFMDKMKLHPEVMVRINMDPSIITTGDMDAIHKEVDRVLELAHNRDKVCIGTGCLPFETDPKIVLKTKEYILSRDV